jgi:outer membrane protein assembly factor BamE (lipoprotein component of BamABCDE complex)
MGRLRRYFNTKGAIHPLPRPPFAVSFRRASLAAIVMVAALAGCTTDVEQRGDLPDRNDLAQIHPGTTRAEVLKLLGSPSSTSVFDPNAWYYISDETKQISFLDPDVLDQQVYVINFGRNGVVTSVEHKTLKDAQNVPMAPGATPAPGRELTFMEQLLGNIGRFNGSSSVPEGENSNTVNSGRSTNLIGF